MRKLLVIAVALVAACSSDTVTSADASAADDLTLAANVASASGAIITTGDAQSLLRLVAALPDGVKLTREQQAKVNALLDAHAAATQADRAAVSAGEKAARDAAQAGKGKGDIQRILDATDVIRKRIAGAEVTLVANITSLLTEAQRKWVREHSPAKCVAVPTLSADQQQQVAALNAAFEDANRADLTAIHDANEAATAAKRAGKSEADVRAILDAVQPAVRRVNAAREALAKAVSAIVPKPAECK
ncbi:MAG: hypothetical protein JWO05_1406 [Gemmatimonadetes bacterium]|nr:hypothetical protein [Gemmatimonadota bacterium]